MRLLSIVLITAFASVSMATQSLVEVRFNRPLELRRFSDFESLEDFNAQKPYTLIGSYQWISGANLTGLNFRGYNATQGGAFEYRLGVSRLKVDAPPISPAALNFGNIEVDDWGYSVGVGYQAAVPLAQNLTWAADFDFVRDAFGDLSYSPSATLSYGLPKQQGLRSYVDVTLGYDFFDPDGADNEDAPSLSLGLALESSQGFGLQYVYVVPSNIQEYSYSILGTYMIPNSNGIKAIFGFRRDDVKYVGLSFRF